MDFADHVKKNNQMKLIICNSRLPSHGTFYHLLSLFHDTLLYILSFR